MAVLAAPIFVGRSAELAELGDAVGRACAGQGGLVLLSGEPGIGKTTLARAVVQLAVDRGARVGWGRAWEQGGAPPLWPWIEALRCWPVAELAAARDDLGPAGALVAPLTGGAGALPAEDHSGTAHSLFPLFDATTRLLGLLGRRWPAVLVLEDVHAADSVSLLLLEFAARVVPTQPVLLLATYRDAEIETDPERREIVPRLRRQALGVPVPALARDEVATLAAALLGPVDDAATARLHETTGGNPLYVQETLRAWRAAGGPLLDRAPAGVRASARERQAQLSPAAREVVEMAAVLGKELDLAPLTALLGEQVVADAVEHATAVGLLRELRDEPGRVAFTHAVVRDAVYDDLAPTRRRDLHRRVGTALEAARAAGRDVPVSQLAAHFWAALPGPDTDKAARYGVAAGDQALQHWAVPEARQQYARAEQLSQQQADPALRCDALLGLAAVEDSFPERRRLALDAAGLARAAGDGPRLARAAARCAIDSSWARPADGEVVALLTEALAASPDPATRSQVLLWLAREAAVQGEVGRAQHLVAEMAALDRTAGGTTLHALALYAEAMLLGIRGPEHALAVLRLADQLGTIGALEDVPELSRLLKPAGVGARLGALLQLGRWQEGRAEVGRLIAWIAAGSADAPAHPELAALAARWSQDLSRRAAAAADLRTYAEQMHDPGWRTVAAVFSFETARELGEQDLLQHHLPALAAQPLTAGLARLARPLVLAEANRLDEGRAALAAIPVEEIRALPRTRYRPISLAVLAEASALLEDETRAAVLADLLAPARGTIIIGYAPFTAVDRVRGLLAAALGDREAAVEAFDAAMALCEQADAPVLLARTEVDYARSLLRSGRVEDRPTALRLATEAAGAANRLGMRKVAADATALLGATTTAGPRPPTLPDPRPATGVAVTRLPGAGERVFRRDGDVWTLAFDGELVRLRDSKGLRALALLLANPGRELHALDVASAGETRDGIRGSDLAATAEPLLDEQARRAYSRRLAELRADRDDAEAACDLARADRAQAELDALETELRRAYGLGGHARPGYTPAERARLSVTKTIKAALDRIGEHSPAFAAHLRATVHTGTYCSYSPDPATAPAWQLR